MLGKIFPIEKGPYHLNKDMRLSAASIIAWRDMTKEQQTQFRERTQAANERAKRVRNRERAANSVALQPRTVTPDPVEETEQQQPEPEPVPMPMDQGMVSLASCQEKREAFIEELEGQTQENPSHQTGKPPATIGQQNDSLVVRIKKSLFTTWAKLKESMTPQKHLAQGNCPQQRSLLVIVNEVADPVPLREVRRPKPQLIVCANSKNDVPYIVQKLADAFPKRGIQHSKYEHIRMYSMEDVKRVNETVLSQERETFRPPPMEAAVNSFVERALRARSKSI